MNQTTLFRAAVVMLVLIGGMMLYFSTHGRHGPRDDGTTPNVVTDEPDGKAR